MPRPFRWRDAPGGRAVANRVRARAARPPRTFFTARHGVAIAPRQQAAAARIEIGSAVSSGASCRRASGDADGDEAWPRAGARRNPHSSGRLAGPRGLGGVRERAVARWNIIPSVLRITVARWGNHGRQAAGPA